MLHEMSPTQNKPLSGWQWSHMVTEFRVVEMQHAYGSSSLFGILSTDERL